jgi:hypothetical protein
MAVKYSGLLKFTDEIKAEINLAADGTVEKAVVIDGDGVETPISGGTTDYTTATLALTNNLSDIVDFAVPNILADPETLNYSDAVVSVEASATETVTVVMFKGKAMCRVLTPLGKDNEATATGSIAGLSPNFEINGNGAITVAAKE